MKNESTNSREENRPAIRKEVLEIMSQWAHKKAYILTI